MFPSPRTLRHLLLLAIGLGGLGIDTNAAQPAPDWWTQQAVRDLDGNPIELTDRWVVMIFISPECPVANVEIPVLNALATEFAPRGFKFIGVYADPTLELPILRRHTAEYRVRFATADDREQRVTHAVHATYTPEVFVFSREGALLYRGRIDDRVTGFGAAKPAAAHEDLREVLAALVAGHPVPFATRPGFGCSIPDPVRK